MKLNKTKTIVLLWIFHFYIFYGITTVCTQYQLDTLHTTFRSFKKSIEFLIMIPLFSIMLGIYYTIFLSIILMIVLIENKKFKIFKSYLISIAFFYISFIALLLYDHYFISIDIPLVTLIALIITGTIIKLVFNKTFKRLDAEYNLH